jgi:hypothetical protein
LSLGEVGWCCGEMKQAFLQINNMRYI